MNTSSDIVEHRWTISHLADRAGVGQDTVRYYLKRGLLDEPGRTPRGHRRFGPDDEARLRMILQGKALGFTLAELRDLVDLWDGSWLTCADLREMLGRKRAELRRRLEETRERLDRIERLESRCACEGPCSPEDMGTMLDPDSCAEGGGACDPAGEARCCKGDSP